MYATVFLILVRQRRRARAPLTLCAQCRHKYAIYASVWRVSVRVYTCVCMCVCVCVKAAHRSRIPETENVLHTRNVARARTCVLYGETWPYVFSRRVFGLPTREREREREGACFFPVDSFRVPNTRPFLPLLPQTLSFVFSTPCTLSRVSSISPPQLL